MIVGIHIPTSLVAITLSTIVVPTTLAGLGLLL